MTALLSKHGDIDYPSRVAKALLKRPDLWGRLLQAVPRKTTILWPVILALL